MGTGENARSSDGTVSLLSSWPVKNVRMEDEKGQLNAPVSQICALSVFPSTVIERVANSTPIVDFVSRLNSLRVNRESTWEEE